MAGGGLVSIRLLPREGPPAQDRVEHPHIVQLRDVFQSDRWLCLVMDAGLANLADYMTEGGPNRPLDETTARFYFQQLIYAVDYCHRTGYLVTDIKLENVLLFPNPHCRDTRPTLKLAEFGSAVNVLYQRMARSDLTSPDYVAPEVFGRGGHEPAKSDVWSCGVVLYVMVRARLPFTRRSYSDTSLLSQHDLRRAIHRMHDSEFDVGEGLSADCADLVRQCLAPSPANRISIGGIMQHKWFQERLPEGAEKLNDEILERRARLSMKHGVQGGWSEEAWDV
ncbi:unnamed protein product [Ostreobium quekettii]|uniref:Protein kinase domain-containing protein n=1 Tax=Ostreobium quekettii TaxID=121088 RepID=A0A8S1JH34_9CHLO|nr:unnamed protein product [Ostreobium quekettii]|eukprot:evm.model.scf_44.6 EVM.evm.TU.scf_44.6   scf_44:103279-105966(+)